MMKNLLLVLIGITLVAPSIAQQVKSGNADVFEFGNHYPTSYTYEMSQFIRKLKSGETLKETNYCVSNDNGLRYEFTVLRNVSSEMTDFFFSTSGGERKSMCGDENRVNLVEVRAYQISRSAITNRPIKLYGPSKYEVKLDDNDFVSISVFISENGKYKFRFFD
jgi:hypothetical protein